MSSETPTTSSAAQWTNAEMLTIVFQILDQLPSIDWTIIELPKGRTLKATKSMLTSFREEIREHNAPTVARPKTPEDQGKAALAAVKNSNTSISPKKRERPVLFVDEKGSPSKRMAIPRNAPASRDLCAALRAATKAALE
ncbi:hypothetical protein MMC25_004312 [Agyrium rufum]|nr:hypothetical protein [Agyrium rufum]